MTNTAAEGPIITAIGKRWRETSVVEQIFRMHAGQPAFAWMGGHVFPVDTVRDANLMTQQWEALGYLWSWLVPLDDVSEYVERVRSCQARAAAC